MRFQGWARMQWRAATATKLTCAAFHTVHRCGVADNRVHTRQPTAVDYFNARIVTSSCNRQLMEHFKDLECCI